MQPLLPPLTAHGDVEHQSRLQFAAAAQIWLREVGLEKELAGETGGRGGGKKSGDSNDIGRFLNRLLGLEVRQQELLIESTRDRA